MLLKFRDFANVTAYTQQQSRKMQNRLVLYWSSMILLMFGVLMLILSLLGVFSDSRNKLGQVLALRENSVCNAVSSHLDSLEAQALVLSEKASAVLEEALYLRPVSSLNNNQEALASVQDSLFPVLDTALKAGQGSGAFVVLDATTNTKAPGAESSRSGMYLRYANLSATKSAQQDVVYFRGIPEIARAVPLEMHNRWNLEFNTAGVPGYRRAMEKEGERLADHCLWTEKIDLTGTWEEVMLLLVPVFDPNGQISGMCGMELSELYFRLSYPVMESEFGDIVTLLAPLDGNRLLLPKGMIGGSEGNFYDPMTSLLIRDGKSFSTYAYDGGSYLGVHRVIRADSGTGDPLAVVTLLPAESFDAYVKAERSAWIWGAAAFLLVAAFLALYLSHSFVKPILTTLEAIRNNTWEEPKTASYLEIDDLFDFLAKKDKEHEDMLHMLEREKQDAQQQAARVQTEFEQVQTEYEQAQTEYETAQAEIARLAYSRKQEVDPDDYQHFLAGVDTLTPTERTIFGHYLNGKTVREIMEIAGIKESTLRYHNRNIYSKLGVNSLKQMLRYAALMKQENGQKPASR